MGITAGTLTATTTLSDALGDPGMQAWLAGSGTDMGGIEFLKTVLSNFQDGLDLPLKAGVDAAGVDVTLYSGTTDKSLLFDASGAGSIVASESGAFGVTVSTNGMFKDPETAPEDGYIKVFVGATEYQVPFYASS